MMALLRVELNAIDIIHSYCTTEVQPVRSTGRCMRLLITFEVKRMQKVETCVVLKPFE